MVVNNNISSVAGNRVLNARQSEVVNSFNKLSSGDSLYSAKLNTLSFAVSEKMRTKAMGVEAAYRNSLDGLSMVNTADGFIQEISNLVNNFRALAVQAASSLYSDEERALSQNMATELVAEINRVTSYATFNGQKLFDGRFAQPTAEVTPVASLWLQVGENQNRAANSIRLFINKLDAGTLTLDDISLSTPEKAIDTIERTENAIASLAKQRSDLGSYQVRLESVVKTNQVALENLKAAESSIRDTDVAAEVTDLTKNLVLNQVNIAMISQANAQLQSILRLLG